MFAPSVFATTFFSGFAGGKLNYSTIEGSEEYSPELKLQAFFQGQFNFSKNLWSHLEISLNTQNLISQSIFHETGHNYDVCMEAHNCYPVSLEQIHADIKAHKTSQF